MLILFGFDHSGRLKVRLLKIQLFLFVTRLKGYVKQG